MEVRTMKEFKGIQTQCVLEFGTFYVTKPIEGHPQFIVASFDMKSLNSQNNEFIPEIFTPEMSQANAKLYEASRPMLKALIDVRNHLYAIGYSTSKDQGERDLFEAAEEAINKALC